MRKSDDRQILEEELEQDYETRKSPRERSHARREKKEKGKIEKR